MTENATHTTFLGHLYILRGHIMRMLLYVVVGAVLAFFADGIVYDTIIFGPRDDNFPTYRFLCFLSENISLWIGMDANMCMGAVDFNIQNRELAGQFNSHLWVSFVSGVILASPLIFWEVWRFVSPALTDKEKKSARGIVFYISVLFFVGILFGYFVILPMSLNFFAGYKVGAMQAVINNIELSSYISNVVNITLATGLMFELPIAIYILSKMELISAKFLRKYYRHAIIVILIFAAILTPPDLVSQIILAIPTLILYQGSIIICERIERKRKLKQQEQI